MTEVDVEPHRWHLWIHSDVGLKLNLREVHAHCKGVSEQKDEALHLNADFLCRQAHLRF